MPVGFVIFQYRLRLIAMKNSPANWLTDGLIDFEYKKYQLLAYLKGVQCEFKKKRLYPIFSDVMMHYQNIL
ncbi:MAG: hypothetical protein COW65_14085 [Cytophagales bacterium CG18_big_fil_WC_8_21_14_2_50_42_9]|nr:MAG: hypothetical protein COW65_14085 [Cytophagales bacterium CG18_big_fil_WC_8_21_14_2_50_42_9]